MLGGTPHLVARDVRNRVTFSPDAKRIAYIRENSPVLGKFQILVSDADGANEKVSRIK